MIIAEPKINVKPLLMALDEMQRQERQIIRTFAFYSEEYSPELLQVLKEQAKELIRLNGKVVEERVKMEDIFQNEIINRLWKNCMHRAASLIIQTIEQMEGNVEKEVENGRA